MTQRPLVATPNISSCSSRRCAPTASSRCRPPGGALRIQPIAGAAADGAGRRSPGEPERLRHRDLPRSATSMPPRRSRRCGRMVSRDGSITASRNSIVVSDFADNVGRIRQVLARIDVDSGVTRIVGLDNAGAREIAAALGELAPEGVSVVPIDSSNVDRAARRRRRRQPARRDRPGARPARRERQRDPGRLPRACRCRAIAAGAPAADRPGADPAAPRARRVSPPARQQCRRRRRATAPAAPTAAPAPPPDAPPRRAADAPAPAPSARATPS